VSGPDFDAALTCRAYWPSSLPGWAASAAVVAADTQSLGAGAIIAKPSNLLI
jgi:hypothetical protein